MAPSEKTTTVVLALSLVLLITITVPLGVKIAQTSDLFLGPYTYHLFLILTVAIIACGGWLSFHIARVLRRRGRLLRAIGFAVYLVIVVVVGFDAVLEFFPYVIPPRVLGNLPFGGNYLYHHGTRTHEFRSDLGFKPRPHVVVEHFYTNDLVRYGQISPVYDYPTTHILFSTDSQGFRNKDKATTADIAVLGDSFTELPYMAFSDIWPNVLARRTGWRVRNFAVSGYGPPQQVEVIRQWVLAYQPRVVILAFYEGNDILECEEFENFERSGLSYPVWLVRRYAGRMGWFQRRPVVAVLRLFLLPYKRIANQWSRESRGSLVGRRTYFNPLEFEAGSRRLKIGLLSVNLKLLSESRERVRSQAGWPLCQEALREMKKLCDRAGATLVIVYVPTKERVYLPLLRGCFTPEAVYDFVLGYHRDLEPAGPDQFEAALFANMDETERVVREFCRDERIVYFDLTASFRRNAQEGQMIYFPYDTHWNALGNKIAAEEIERFLRQQMAGDAQQQPDPSRAGRNVEPAI